MSCSTRLVFASSDVSGEGRSAIHVSPDWDRRLVGERATRSRYGVVVNP